MSFKIWYKYNFFLQENITEASVFESLTLEMSSAATQENYMGKFFTGINVQTPLLKILNN